MANPQADLHGLSIRRPDTEPVADLRVPRRWGSRVLFPLALLAGFGGLLLWSAWDLLLPPLAVRVVPVLVKTGVIEATGQELFKANGWVEPRPLPIDVPIQTEGMYRLKELRVVPGQEVKAGEVLLRLDDEVAKLDVQTSERRLAKRKAAARSAEADVGKAGTTLKNAETLKDLAKLEGEGEIKTAEADAVKAEAQLASADLAVRIQEKIYQSGLTALDAKLEQARIQSQVAQAEKQSAKARVERARTALVVRVQQALAAVAAAQADLVSMQAKVDEVNEEVGDAAIEVARARLELARTEIRSPIDGVVMQLTVNEGAILGGKNVGMNASGQRDAAIRLYAPNLLQVRVEVPTAKFALVKNGQPAVIELEDVLPGQRFQGKVLYDTHFANIARNSVPVKVAIDDPPKAIRPEMIASVRFLNPTPTKSDGETVRRLLIPKKWVRVDGNSHQVWIVDQARGRAELRSVELPSGEMQRPGDMVEIAGGLDATDRLIASGIDGLKVGTRVRIAGEER